MGLSFEWDEHKAQENVWRHGVSFEESSTIFGDPLSLTIDDPLHSIEEDRFVTIGLSNRGRIVVVVHAEREDNVRIITAPLRRRGKEGHMEQEPGSNSDSDILEEYDFTKGVRGKYAEGYAAGDNLVVLDPDVAEVFPDSAAVNLALRALADIMRQHSGKTPS
jgi:uncharacterized DUF497 family protein